MADKPTEGLAPPPGPGLDTYYLNVIKNLEKLEAKLRAGEMLTAEETESLNTYSKEFEALRTDNPGLFNRLVSFVNETRKSAGTTGPGGATDIGGYLSSSFSERTNRNITSNTQTKQTTREYVDLPTPEEFLDDFTNAYNIHITGLVQSGAIRPEVAAFAREMQNEIFGEYLREQTKRMLSGEPLWKVVGLNADEKVLGARQGDSYARDSTSNLVSKDQTSRSETTTGGASGATTGAGQAVEGASESGTSEYTENRRDTDVVDESEYLVSRNRLTYVANLAPLDFMKGGASAQRLNFLYAAQKGTAQRAAQTATGGDYAGARRI